MDEKYYSRYLYIFIKIFLIIQNMNLLFGELIKSLRAWLIGFCQFRFVELTTYMTGTLKSGWEFYATIQ